MVQRVVAQNAVTASGKPLPPRSGKAGDSSNVRERPGPVAPSLDARVGEGAIAHDRALLCAKHASLSSSPAPGIAGSDDLFGVNTSNGNIDGWTSRKTSMAKKQYRRRLKTNRQRFQARVQRGRFRVHGPSMARRAGVQPSAGAQPSTRPRGGHSGLATTCHILARISGFILSLSPPCPPDMDSTRPGGFFLAQACD